MNLSRSFSFSPFQSVGIDWPTFIQAHQVTAPEAFLPSQTEAVGFSPLRYVGGVLLVEVVTYTREVDPEVIRRIAVQEHDRLYLEGTLADYQDVYGRIYANRLAATTPKRREVGLLIDDDNVVVLAAGRAAEGVEEFIRQVVEKDAQAAVAAGEALDGSLPRLISCYAAARERVQGTTPMPVLWAWKNVSQGEFTTVGLFEVQVVGPVKVKNLDVKASLGGDLALQAAGQLEQKMGATPLDLWLESRGSGGLVIYHLTPTGFDKAKIVSPGAKSWKGYEPDEKVALILRVVGEAAGLYEALLQAEANAQPTLK